MALVLASQSPRRRQLMGLVASAFEVDVADVDESALRGDAARVARALACLKAQAVAAKRPDDTVVGCDTVVEIDGRVLGKPQTGQQAYEMLGTLSGAQHLVHTGVCIVLPHSADAPDCFVESTAVNFAPLPPDEIAAYVQTDEPYDKAGAYGIQGWAARYITGVNGCFYNVMGLPVAALHARLRALGVLP